MISVSLGLNNDVSAGDDYTMTQLWSRAIYDSDPRWDGIRYVSRQSNRGFAYAIFDRSGLRKARYEAIEKVERDLLCTCFRVATTRP